MISGPPGKQRLFGRLRVTDAEERPHPKRPNVISLFELWGRALMISEISKWPSSVRVKRIPGGQVVPKDEERSSTHLRQRHLPKRPDIRTGVPATGVHQPVRRLCVNRTPSQLCTSCRMPCSPISPRLPGAFHLGCQAVTTTAPD